MALAALLSASVAYSLNAPRASMIQARRVSALRMDDFPQTKAVDPNVVTSNRENFACSFEIPKKGISEYGTVNMNFKPLLATKSELVVVRYDLPFGLSAEPKRRVVVVTQDGAQYALFVAELDGRRVRNYASPRGGAGFGVQRPRSAYG